MSAEPFKKDQSDKKAEDLAFVQAGMQKITQAAQSSDEQKQLAMSRYFFLNQARNSAFDASLRFMGDFAMWICLGFLGGFVGSKIVRGIYANSAKARRKR